MDARSIDDICFEEDVEPETLAIIHDFFRFLSPDKEPWVPLINFRHPCLQDFRALPREALLSSYASFLMERWRSLEHRRFLRAALQLITQVHDGRPLTNAQLDLFMTRCSIDRGLLIDKIQLPSRSFRDGVIPARYATKRRRGFMSRYRCAWSVSCGAREQFTSYLPTALASRLGSRGSWATNHLKLPFPQNQ